MFIDTDLKRRLDGVASSVGHIVASVVGDALPAPRIICAAGVLLARTSFSLGNVPFKSRTEAEAYKYVLLDTLMDKSDPPNSTTSA